MIDRIQVARTLGATFYLVCVLAGVALLMTGGASAADVTIHNTTVPVDGDTSDAYAEVTNNNLNSSANVTVTYTGIEGNNSTQLASNALVVSANSSTLDTVAVDGTAYDEVRVEATLDNTTVSESDVTVESGTFQKTTDGAGGGSSSFGGLSDMELGGLAVLVFGVGYVLLKED